MRKLFVMLVVMAVVFGMSAGVMAEELANDVIPINASIAEKATIDADGTIDLNIDNLLESENDGDHTESNFVDVVVRANTSVKVSFEENLSRKLADILGNDNLVWAFDGYFHETNGLLDYDNWVVSPNLLVRYGDTGEQVAWKYPEGGEYTMYMHNDGMGKDVYLEQGKTDLEVNMHTKWRQLDDNEDMLSWYDLVAQEDISAEVTVTVAAD